MVALIVVGCFWAQSVAQATQFTRYQAVVYTMRTYDPILSAGLEASLPLGVLSETRTQARSGATLFYASDYAPNSAGIVGWQVASRRILSFSIAAGAVSNTELEHPTIARLLANAIRYRGRCRPTRSLIPIWHRLLTRMHKEI